MCVFTCCSVAIVLVLVNGSTHTLTPFLLFHSQSWLLDRAVSVMTSAFLEQNVKGTCAVSMCSERDVEGQRGSQRVIEGQRGSQRDREGQRGLQRDREIMEGQKGSWIYRHVCCMCSYRDIERHRRTLVFIEENRGHRGTYRVIDINVIQGRKRSQAVDHQNRFSQSERRK